MSTLNVDKVDPNTGTALEIGTSGDTITVPSGATLDISSATLTPPATLPASSGVNLTALNASNLGSGTVPTARLGSGTASGTTFLSGDQTYKAAGGGKILQVVSTSASVYHSTTSSTFQAAGDPATTITPASSSNKILILGTWGYHQSYTTTERMSFQRAISGGATTDNIFGETNGSYYSTSASSREMGGAMNFLDSPSTTSAITYKFMFSNTNNSSSVLFGDANTAATITCIEIDLT